MQRCVFVMINSIGRRAVLEQRFRYARSRGQRGTRSEVQTGISEPYSSSAWATHAAEDKGALGQIETKNSDKAISWCI